jgi:hypothetical protein
MSARTENIMHVVAAVGVVLPLVLGIVLGGLWWIAFGAGAAAWLYRFFRLGRAPESESGPRAIEAPSPPRRSAP